MKYFLLFALIQLVNIPLTVLGWLLCLSPGLAKLSWLWWNDEDGVGGRTTWWGKYTWLAWRNSVGNYKHVPGVSKIGRPLIYRGLATVNADGIIDKRWYFKAGWMGNGYPCLSFGAGRGY